MNNSSLNDSISPEPSAAVCYAKLSFWVLFICKIIIAINIFGIAANVITLVFSTRLYMKRRELVHLFLAGMTASDLITILFCVTGLYVCCVWLLTGWVYRDQPSCLQIKLAAGFYEAHTIIVCSIPIASSFLVSAYLFHLTRKVLRQQSAGCRSQAALGADASQMQSQSYAKKIKSIAFIFATSAWTAVSLLPYRVFSVLRVHSAARWHSYEACSPRWLLMHTTAWALLYLLMLNPAINPVITLCIYAPYRRKLIKVLRSCRRKFLCRFVTFDVDPQYGGQSRTQCVSVEHNNVLIRNEAANLNHVMSAPDFDKHKTFSSQVELCNDGGGPVTNLVDGNSIPLRRYDRQVSAQAALLQSPTSEDEYQL